MPDGSFVWAPPPARLRFQHRYRVHIVLFVATFVTTTFKEPIAALLIATLSGQPTAAFQFFTWEFFRYGLWYSIPLLAILGAHEFGHYYYCRRHNVDASLPYFLPAPLPLTGTLGAVIRIKEAFPSMRALFDIGVAGPIAGFVVLVPLLYWGVGHSAVMTIPPNTEVVYFGEPLLIKAAIRWHFGVLAPGTDVMLHPVGFAAWFGMLATALNLLPFGQLDGGHIAYAVFGSRARFISIATLVVTVLLTVQSFSWILTAAIMTLMAVMLGFRHPRVIDEGMPLDRNRQLVAAAALLIFIICFTPVPIETFFSK